MRTHTLHLILAVLAALNGPAALTATEYRVSDFLPLAVGNSWSCIHQVRDSYLILDGPPGPWTAWKEANGAFTLTVERTEEIDGETYFVLSDMPSGGWPSAPPGFIAGRKLRWKGSQLMEHTGSGEQTLYDFGGPEVYEYDPTTETYPVPRKSFISLAPDLEEWLKEASHTDEEVHGGRSIEFLAKYGMWACYEGVAIADAGAFRNRIGSYEAALIESAEGTGGPRGSSGESKVVRKRNYDQARRGEPGTITPLPSSVSPSSWGEVKESDR